jgi:hypothetical protein
LHKYRFEEIAARGYPDGVFASDYDIVSDTSKARRFGFHELVVLHSGFDSLSVT